MQVDVFDSISAVDPGAWNALNRHNNPFMRFEFLAALEQCHCVGAPTGWVPRHIVISDHNTIVAAAPTYEKNHSWGEYIFDWAWANAYQRCGKAYYPKLVTTAPFTAASGPRLLVSQHTDSTKARRSLIDATIDCARSADASTVHWLFTDNEDTTSLINHGLICRTGFQFHWQNQNFDNFDNFLATLASKKRKNIKRERRRVAEMGVHTSVVTANLVTDDEWERFYYCYTSTSQRKGGEPYLTLSFFRTIAATMPDQVLLVRATYEGQLVAGALCLRSDDTLYGRHWGSLDTFDSVHFETCFYAPIDYAITHRISRFEAGAQGEHKIARGFLPTPIYSAHWIADPQFRKAIARFAAEEEKHIREAIDELNTQSPYKANLTAGCQN